jgi:hypothetical protein
MVVVQRRAKLPLVRRKAPHAPKKKVSASGRMKLSVAATAARERRRNLVTGVARISTLTDALIKSAADTLSVQESVIRSQLHRSTSRIEDKREPNHWNGFLHMVGEEANEG